MTKAVREYLRKNAVMLANRAATGSIIIGTGGGFRRADGEVPVEILRQAFMRHFRRPGRPTVVRLTLDQMSSFPGLVPKEWGGPFAWLVIVSDSCGRFSYAISQEGDFTEDPHLLAVAAQAQAQLHACKMLTGDLLPASCGAA